MQQALSSAGIEILDGDAVEIFGIGFVGVKGFCGGFGEQALQPWGEPSIKSFVQEALKESLKLESALAKLRTEQRIALLHYAPIRATVVGEPARNLSVSGLEPARRALQSLSGERDFSWSCAPRFGRRADPKKRAGL